MKQTAVVICPGRGTYNATELGYLKKHHSDKTEFIALLDQQREANNQTSISELDAASAYSIKKHTSSENASSIIYACAVADFQAINQEKYDIVAITGNSMGWYLALACAGALSYEQGMMLVNTMGNIMQHHGQGGQILYPTVDENWVHDAQLKATLDETVAGVKKVEGTEVYSSIHLGGFEVLAANKKALGLLAKNLPPVQDRYPLILPNHAAFHSPIMKNTSKIAKEQLSATMFNAPNVPLIDGRGRIWQSFSTDRHALYDYTLEDQVHDTYNYSSVIETSIKEFAPDKLIILGPGSTLGAPTAQELINHHWHKFNSKADFIEAQSDDPFVLSMGMNELQRNLVTQ
ncbi:ACP S-malonyltransferase [Pleionea sp. CnH1-48]|uniref:ACP S-malonyltransferase n=1 Tax=Pleionea sp. CnH1-48 TaxID=2954494 RepID=UPI002098110E|nr:ACP S-malonyltransferase [Pleionea sp. CnH1-48]MCO7224963.1 ACP S-malonyltransferase [Pleionea sp. CnH1-48]